MNILEHLKTVISIKGALLDTTIGDLPTDKDNCISIFQISGNVANFFGSASIKEPIIRVVIRNTQYAAGIKIADKIEHLLNKYSDEIIISSHIQSSTSYLGKDDKRRNIWDIAFKIRF